ncbi:hypothetical protein, partial [Mesorhizobium sophorae]|uniref:hypothetical protein n=1 Tax=Mesorhizobium sophorae TaxID=1300294 RepID=UPI00197F997E
LKSEGRQTAAEIDREFEIIAQLRLPTFSAMSGTFIDFSNKTGTRDTIGRFPPDRRSQQIKLNGSISAGSASSTDWPSLPRQPGWNMAVHLGSDQVQEPARR